MLGYYVVKQYNALSSPSELINLIYYKTFKRYKWINAYLFLKHQLATYQSEYNILYYYYVKMTIILFSKFDKNTIRKYFSGDLIKLSKNNNSLNSLDSSKKFKKSWKGK